MRLIIACLFMLALMVAGPAFAVMDDYPSVKLQGLDKSVGRTVTFEATVGSTIQYGPLFIKIHACRKSSPIEKPESAAFLQIWEVPPGADKSEWVFSGWMFASSPALSAMDHPVYDVWVLDCLGKEKPNAEAAAAQSKEEADQTNLTAPDGDGALPETTPEQQTDEPVIEDSEAENIENPAQRLVPQTAPTISPSLPTRKTPDDPGFSAYDLMQ